MKYTGRERELDPWWGGGCGGVRSMGMGGIVVGVGLIGSAVSILLLWGYLICFWTGAFSIGGS